MLNNFLANFRWYRRLKGGTWHRVRPRTEPNRVFWIQDDPINIEDVLDKEVYETER